MKTRDCDLPTQRYVQPKQELSESSKQFNEVLFHVRGAQFLRVPMPFYKLMTADEAQVLAYLIWKRDGLERADLLPKDGAFYATVQNLRRDIQIPESRQRRIFERLQTRRYIRVEHRGMPRKRFVHIDRQSILEDVEQSYELDLADSIAEFRKDPKSFFEKYPQQSVRSD